MSCPKPPSKAAELHRAIAAAHLALAAHLEGEEDAGAPIAPPPPLPKVKQRRGPRIPSNIVITPELVERVRKAGGILGE